MGKFFDLDSPVIRFLNLVSDMLILNLLVIVCCIPIITAGPAFTAMHYVILKRIRGEEGYLVRGFFKSFARNFKQAVLIWLMMLLVIAVYVGDSLIFHYSGIVFPTPLIVAVGVVGVIACFIAIYIFPLLARFDNTIRNTIKNAAVLAFVNLPRTISMAVFYVLPFVIAYFSTYSYIFIFMFGISVPAYGAAWMYSGIFKKFEPEPEQVSDMNFTLNVEWGEEESNGKSE